MMNNDHTATRELFLDIILQHLDNAADLNPPRVEMGHAGLPIPLDCLETFSISIPEFSSRLMTWLGRMILSNGYKSFVDVDIDIMGGLMTIRCPYHISSAGQREKTLDLHLTWGSNLELI